MTEPKNIDTPDKKFISEKRSQIIPGGFAGTGPNGSFFETPEWVDKNKPPGLTSQEKMYAPPGIQNNLNNFFLDDLKQKVLW